MIASIALQQCHVETEGCEAEVLLDTLSTLIAEKFAEEA